VGSWITVDVLLDGPLRQLDHQVSRLMLATGIRDTDWPAPLFLVKLGVYATTKLGAQNPMLVLTGSAVGLLAWRRRTVRPLLLLAALLILLGVSVQLAKHAVGRSMPAVDGLHVPANRWAPAGRSFPSGHMPVAVTLWGLLGYLAADYRLNRRLAQVLGVLRWLAPALTFVTMLLLDYHWLTDLIAGLALGVVLLRIGCEVDTRALRDWSGAQQRGGQLAGAMLGAAGAPAGAAGSADVGLAGRAGAAGSVACSPAGRPSQPDQASGSGRSGGHGADPGPGLGGHRAAGLG
jgi:membrane-associated phospholipid phosphatase